MKVKVPTNVKKVYDKYLKEKLITENDQTDQKIKEQLDHFQESRSDNYKLQDFNLEELKDEEKNLTFTRICRLNFKGRDKTWYQNKLLQIYILFQDGYPEQPPEMMFADIETKKGSEPFIHINVSPSGHICSSVLTHQSKQNGHYKPTMTLAELILNVENVLYKRVNVQSAYDSKVFEAYDTTDKNGGKEYDKLLRQQSNKLKLWQEE